MINSLDDTIVALATPQGSGGLAVVRISGASALKIGTSIFTSQKTKNKIKPWRLYAGWISDNDEKIDQVLLSYFRTPNSYTAEDVIEISCHGGSYVSRRIVELIVAKGARLAEPGEFTKRAFLNSRIDLSQAEAVADVIHAQSQLSLKASIRQLEGQLFDDIKLMQNELVDVRMLLELELDFSEEDIEFVDRERLYTRIQNMLDKMQILINSYKHGKIVREGVKVVIVGRPNVGKSSLLNALLKKNRAIVTDIPGTTRDTIEEAVEINGQLFRLIDTAGIVETDDIVEREGVQRSQRESESADVILLVLDASQKFTKEDERIVQNLQISEQDHSYFVIPVLNKIDKIKQLDFTEISTFNFSISPIEISARNYIGIDEFKKVLVNHVKNQFADEPSLQDHTFITRVRHLKALQSAKNYLEKAKIALDQKRPSEFIAFDIRQSIDSLGEIIGSVTSEDILNRIFESFCIGK